MPGSTDWAYIPGDAVWRFISRDDGRWVKQLAWCPEVTDAVRYPAQDGRTITRSFKITVGNQTEVVSAGDLVRGVAWPKFAVAAGFTGRAIGDVLVNIVTDQASQLPDVIGYPYFHDGSLRLPPAEYLPDGYTRGEGSTLAALAALVVAVAPYPVAALQMGLSAVAPWVGGLQSQPFTLHVVGDSTVGKSTALYASAALWGVGYRRVAPPWAGTKIGIPGSFRDLGVLPAFRDELGTAGLPPSDRVALFTTIMEGCRRTARTRDDLARPSASWESVCFSTGNISAVPASHASAGTPKGLIEIHADRTRPVIPAEAKARVRRLTNAPETAGAWVPHALRLPVDDVRAEVERAGKDLGDPDEDGLEWHMWRAMSLALAGARVLAGVTGVPELAASAELAAREVIAATEDRLAEIGADHGARLADTVREYLSIRPAAFGLGDARDNAHTDQLGFEATTADGAELICVFPAKHGEIARAAEVEDVTAALRQLRESGQLHTTKGKGLRYAARRDDRIVHVYAYNLNAQTGGNGGNGGNGAGQGPDECYPPGGNKGHVQGVTGSESPAPARGRCPACEYLPPMHAADCPDLPPLPPEPDADEDGYDPPELAEPRPESERQAVTVAELAASADPAAPIDPPFVAQVRAYLAECAGAGLDPKYHPTADGAVKLIIHHGKAEADAIRETFASLTASSVPAEDSAPAGTELAEAEPASTAPADDTDPAPEPAQTRSEPRPAVTGDDELAAFTRAMRKLDPDASDADLTAALGIWHDATGGVRWVSYSGQVGQAWLAKLTAQYPSMKAPAPLASERVREVIESGPLTRINYVAKPRSPVRPGKHYVTSYDINGQYPAAAGSVELGDGEPEVIESPRQLGGLVSYPGYVRLSKALRTGHPAFGTRPAGEWIAMPLVKFLAADLGLTVPAAEVIYWPHKGRRLSVYVGHYRKARDKLAGMEQTGPVRLALAVLKDQANALFGMFHSETYSHGGWFRPDWHDMIASTADANALRALAKCKTAPVAKQADSAYWIAGHAPFEPDGLTISGQLGKWKLDRHGPASDDLVAAVKSGGPAAFRDAVIAIDAERRAGS